MLVRGEMYAWWKCLSYNRAVNLTRLAQMWGTMRVHEPNWPRVSFPLGGKNQRDPEGWTIQIAKAVWSLE